MRQRQGLGHQLSEDDEEERKQGRDDDQRSPAGDLVEDGNLYEEALQPRRQVDGRVGR